ncbi:hypothetical protein V7O66_02755 [Methanolobus sp. ZRKC3]|uniref:hypothetical protein n=1 Tax=Methanolobus sp. ZRKC3 TaxID=3125786 RepID=UPI00324F6920
MEYAVNPSLRLENFRRNMLSNGNKKIKGGNSKIVADSFFAGNGSGKGRKTKIFPKTQIVRVQHLDIGSAEILNVRTII